MNQCEIPPDMTNERLSKLVEILQEARKSALEPDCFRTDLGDNAWTVGTQFYQRAGWAIQEASEDGTCPWLRVIKKMPELIFMVGRIPVRFSTDYGSFVPRKKHRSSHHVENLAVQGAFDFRDGWEQLPKGCVWRILCEVGKDLDLTNILLVVWSESQDTLMGRWELWSDGSDANDFDEDFESIDPGLPVIGDVPTSQPLTNAEVMHGG